jgi:tRNA pseudouridine38-40 synthase
MTERNIRLVLAYDGTEFAGWQRQAGARTVQEELESSLARMHGHPVAVAGAGRTDAGVHARGQAANFRTDIASIPEGRFALALNSLLPKDLRVLSSERVAEGFHARFDAISRTYRYFLAPLGADYPERRPYAWKLKRMPDLAALNRAAACLLGERDFTTFSAKRDECASRWRYVYEASFFAEGSELVFAVRANAFLWRMVRSLVGSLVHYQEEGREPSYAGRALEARDRGLAGPTAPPEGLFLWSVEYDEKRAKEE